MFGVVKCRYEIRSSITRNCCWGRASGGTKAVPSKCLTTPINKWWRTSSVKTSVKQNHTESTVASANSPRVKRPERDATYIHLVLRWKMCVAYFHSTVFGAWWLDTEADILSQAMCNWKCSNKLDFLCVLCMQKTKKTHKQVPVRNLFYFRTYWANSNGIQYRRPQ